MVAALLATGFFMQAVFAGAILSGVVWARQAHSATAVILVVASLAAGLTSAATLRRFRQGQRLALALLALAAATLVQAAMGAMSAKGANLIWAHVPLGVALVALAGQSVARARRLNEA